jgi:hypothetical protein
MVGHEFVASRQPPLCHTPAVLYLIVRKPCLKDPVNDHIQVIAIIHGTARTRGPAPEAAGADYRRHRTIGVPALFGTGECRAPSMSSRARQKTALE